MNGLPERRAGGEAEVGAVRRIVSGPRRDPVHLVGVGGVGMAGLAVHLAARGWPVSGCDRHMGRIAGELAARGISVTRWHDPAHLAPGTGWVIRSAAVSDTEPELLAAGGRGIPVFRRGAVLPALLDGRRSVAVAGTHGKTTTSAMIVHLLRAAGQQPGYCIGGEVDGPGIVAEAGSGGVLVAEADESDGTLALYQPDVAVVTNLEFDHMEHFESEAALRDCFDRFARQARRRVVYCADDPRASDVCRGRPGAASYGWSERADLHAELIEAGPEGSRVRLHSGEELVVPVPGRHNALNALGALLAARQIVETPYAELARGLAGFRPVRRRYERVGEACGVRVISDYAHHPTEIRAVLQTALLQPARRRVVIFQPHRYTRTRALGAEFPPAFEGADEVWLTPVYAASEPPIEGGATSDLLRHFRAQERGPVAAADSPEAAWEAVKGRLAPGDLLLVLGAGDVDNVAGRAMEELNRLAPKGQETR